MKTRLVTPPEMESLTARYASLEPMKPMQNEDIPLEARDKVWSRKLLPVASPKGGESPFGLAPIRDQDFSITYAVCPPGTGPGLHAHHYTTETFTCLKGRFRVYWGDKGEYDMVLEPFDVVAVPPGVCRGFTNIADEEGMLQVLITGGVHDMQDIAFPPSIGEEIDNIRPGLLEYFKETGLMFNAGVDDAGADR